MNQMTDNEKFFNGCVDGVYKLLKQAKQSTTVDGVCMYRLDSVASCPIRCAVGHMIKDEHYTGLEEVSVRSDASVLDSVRKSLDMQYISEEQQDILSYIQVAHDRVPAQHQGESFVFSFLNNLQKQAKADEVVAQIYDVVKDYKHVE